MKMISQVTLRGRVIGRLDIVWTIGRSRVICFCTSPSTHGFSAQGLLSGDIVVELTELDSKAPVDVVVNGINDDGVCFVVN